jgi:hypothetical protein
MPLLLPFERIMLACAGDVVPKIEPQFTCTNTALVVICLVIIIMILYPSLSLSFLCSSNSRCEQSSSDCGVLFYVV